jgi:hypothetical protein
MNHQQNHHDPRPFHRLHRVGRAAAALGLALLAPGCAHPRITAVNLNDPKEPHGIPYYLPKPYLIVSKNIRYIPAPTVGLTTTVPIPAGFDQTGATNGGGGGKASPTNQTTQTQGGGGGAGHTNAVTTAAGTNSTPANPPGASAGGSDGAGGGSSSGTAYGSQVLGPASIAVVPPASIADGLIPQEFYTYQIVFLPDLTQKYGLRIKGGAGEFRATENLVNGWMHTGPGPIYMRDSFTAQSVTASGEAVANVGGTLGQVALSAFGIPTLPGAAQAGAAAKSAGAVVTGAQTNKAALTAAAPAVSEIRNYAQIYVFEPVVIDHPDGSRAVEWRQMGGLPSFSRDWIELERAAAATTAPSAADGGNSQAQSYILDQLTGGTNAARKWQVTAVTVTSDAADKTMLVTVTVKAASVAAADRGVFEQAAKAAADSWLNSQGSDWTSQVKFNYAQ